MKFKVYNGKLGRETWLADMEYPTVPHKGDLIAVGEDEASSDTYEVLQTFIAPDGFYDCNYSLFVKMYDWEG